MTHQRTLTAAHWGVYEVEYDEHGKATRLHPFSKDPDPSPIGLHMLSDEVSRLRVRRPAVRKSWLEHGPGAAPELRGQEPFVEVPWDEALDLVAGELTRVKDRYSNRAIFGGSYGWSSAGRFHHAQSQVQRFLNSFGGFVRHIDSYSLGAARVLMPHIVASMEELMAMHTRWDVLAKDCKLFVTFGGVPHKNAQINAGGATLHHVKGGLYAMREQGVRFVNVTPTAEDLDTGGAGRVAGDPAEHRCRADAGALPHAARREPARPRLPRPLHGGLRQVRALPRRQGRRRGRRRSPAFRQAASWRWRARWPRRARRSASAGRCSAAITASSPSGRW